MNRPLHRLPLQWLISLAIVASLVILGLTQLTLSYQSSRATLLDATEESANQAGTILDGHLNRLIWPVQAALGQLQFDPVVSAETYTERFERVPALAQMLNANPLLSAVYVGYPNGDFVLLRTLRQARAQRLLDPPEGAAFLLQSIEFDAEQNSTGRWAYFSPELTLLEDREREDYRFDPRERPWYQSAQGQPGASVLTQPYVFFTTGEIGITMASQVATGGPVLGLDASVEDLSGQILDLRVTPGTQMAMVSGEGRVLGYPDLQRIILGSGEDLRLAMLSELNLPMLESLISADVAANSLYSSNISGRRWYSFWVPLTEFEGDDIRLLMSVPADELLDGALSTLLQQAIWSLVIILLLLPFGWLLGKRIGSPLRELSDQVARLGQFDFGAKIGVASNISEVHQLGDQTQRLASMIRSFNDINHSLNRSTDLDQMLEAILTSLMSMTEATAGGIYLYHSEQQQLQLAQAHQFSQAPTNLKPGSAGVSDVVNTLEKALSNRSDSLLVVPLQNREEEVIGALVLCVAQNSEVSLAAYRKFAYRLSGSVAVAIETRQLLQQQRALIDAIIKVLADAIDTKSPYTGGHCDRVPHIATLLLNQVEAVKEGPFADFRLSEKEHYEFTIAAWLHDCGKIVIPEYIVDKATKLETIHNRIHEVRTRFDILWRDADIAALKAQLDGVPEAKAQQERDRIQAQLQDDFAFIANMNIGGEALSDDDIARMERIADRTWQRHFSDRLGLSMAEARHLAGFEEPALPVTDTLLADKPEHRVDWGPVKPPVEADNPDNHWGFRMVLPEHSANHGERYNLSIRRGTLNPEERFKINNHIVETLRMLTTLPWPNHLKAVPDIAANHHERMDGLGYPRGLTGEQMSVSERVMAIADVFEALTAADRPYKPAKTLTESLNIMVKMGREQHLDKALLRLFIESGVYRHYAEDFLLPEQLCEIDEEAILATLDQPER